MMVLREKIRKKITDNGWSVTGLEKKAGLRPGRVHNILSGRSKNPSIHTVKSIADAFNCSLNDLLEQHESTVHLKQYPKGEVPDWDRDLYLSCVTYIIEVLNRRNITIAKDSFTQIIEEIYLYSARTNSSEVDKNFVEWILDKTITKSL